METALSVSVEHGMLDLLQYLVETVGVTLTGELYILISYSSLSSVVDGITLTLGLFMDVYLHFEHRLSWEVVEVVGDAQVHIISSLVLLPHPMFNWLVGLV